MKWPKAQDHLLPYQGRDDGRPGQAGQPGQPDSERWPPNPLDNSRFAIEVVTTAGQALAVTFRVRLDTVEVTRAGRTLAVLDRDVLRAWLAHPEAELAVDEITFTWDRMVDQSGRIALSLPDVHHWTLSPRDMVTLTARL